MTPYLMLDDAPAFGRFLKDTFGASQNGPVAEDGDGNVMHADFVIGDSHIMFGSATDAFPATQNSLHLYVADCDKIFERAVAAGAKVLRRPNTEFYGDRGGSVRDAWGNTWLIATHVEDVAPDEMEKRQKKWLEQMQDAA